jgi:hypothetical protein
LACRPHDAGKSGEAPRRGGLQPEAQPLILYTTNANHSSVEKGALLAGFGRDNVRMVATHQVGVATELAERRLAQQLRAVPFEGSPCSSSRERSQARGDGGVELRLLACDQRERGAILSERERPGGQVHTIRR